MKSKIIDALATSFIKPFPKLMIDKKTGTVVLFESNKQGMCLFKKDDTDGIVGKFYTSRVMNNFEDINDITINFD